MSTEKQSAENDRYGFLSSDGYPDEGPNPLIKQHPADHAAPLWEHEHPYYGSTGNYYEGHPFNGTREGTWVEFLEEMDDADEDMNLVYRWDWIKADPSDYECEREEDPDFEMPGDRLMVFYMGQRKAYCWSWEVVVTEADEPAVREWLAKKADHMALLWSPFLTRVIPPATTDTTPTPAAPSRRAEVNGAGE